jgi:predicted DNA-binding transcriptional regulator AlpA
VNSTPTPDRTHTSLRTAAGRCLPPGLLRREQAARYCGAGVSTWDRWTAAGLTPAPVRIGGAVFWSRAELAEWCRHGCPPRTQWMPMWQAQLRARRVGPAK